jgi:hypothetical protein
VIAHGAKIGAEGPVTIDNWQLGAMAELKGGYFKGSVFLAKANMGLGAHVREACIFEEEANPILALAKKERTSRLIAMVEKVPPSHKKCQCQTGVNKRLCELHANTGDVCRPFKEEASDSKAAELGDRFLNAFEKYRRASSGEYVQVIQSMPETISQDGVRWLQQVVDVLCRKAGALLSPFALF